MDKKRVAALDYGRKRLGLAISDERRVIATPLECLLAEKTHQETILKLVARLAPYSIETLLIGYPLHLNGTRSPLAEEVEAFAALLGTQVSYPVKLYDERLSSMQANKVLQEGNLRRKSRDRLNDTISALILLQCYLGYT